MKSLKSINKNDLGKVTGGTEESCDLLTCGSCGQTIKEGNVVHMFQHQDEYVYEEEPLCKECFYKKTNIKLN